MPTAEQITAHDVSRNGARPGSAGSPAAEQSPPSDPKSGDTHSETVGFNRPEGPLRLRVSIGYTKSGGWAPKDFTVDATWDDRNNVEGDQLITYGRMAQRVIEKLCEEFNRPRPEDTPF